MILRVLPFAALFAFAAGCGQQVAPAPSPAPSAPSTMAVAAVAPLADPDRIEIPALGVTDELVPVGLAPNRQMEIPDVDEVGWYEPGVPLGAPGPAVVAGHVDYEGVPGAFKQLSKLKPGDDIVVVGKDGRTLIYDVYEVREFPKAAFDFEFVFGDRPAAELVAVTCSGPVENRSYLNNTAVAARLVTP